MRERELRSTKSINTKRFVGDFERFVEDLEPPLICWFSPFIFVAEIAELKIKLSRDDIDNLH